MRKVTLVAFDFDGTLAPIREDPASVRLDRAAAALLRELADLPGVVVAVVSGRDAEDVAARAQAPAAYIVGSHGLEIRAPGGTVVRDSPALSIEFDEQLGAAINGNGLRVERKKHGVALHWRGRHSEEVAAVVERFREWGGARGLDLIDGRCVIEARCRGGGKEEALRWLAAASGASRVLYAGDDVTDFGPLRLAAERGRAFFIASSERNPPAGVTVVRGIRELLPVIREEFAI